MSSPPLILVCDHRGEGLSECLAQLADAGFRLEFSADVHSSREQFARAHPALLVLDPLAEGGAAEVEELERIAGVEGAPPLLLVTDPRDPSAALRTARGSKSPVVDLVHRGSTLGEYRLRLERLWSLAERQGEMRDLRHRALHDDRTDLLRPKAFQQRLGEHFSAAERHHFDLALVLIDLDDFGRVNKLFDHTVGDLVIVRVGEAIRRALRTEDVAGRIGGDEFAVMLPYTGGVEAAHVVKRLRDEIHRLSGRATANGAQLAISASLGFETFDGKDVESVEALRAHAELALREAKRTGGNRGVYFRSIGTT